MTGDVSAKGTRVLRITLWVFWGLWAVACVVLAVGAVANHLASRTQTLPLVLSPGASAEITVYRFIDDRLRLRLRYPPNAADPALDPGVLMRVDTPNEHADFRAGVRSGPAGTDIVRRLETVETAVFTAAYFGYGRGDALPRGRSWLRVTVLEVEPALVGRPATVEVQPPLDLLKLTDLDYLWLWPFFFWKVVALLLLVPGIALVIFTIALRRGRRRSPLR
ncbi:hypothetical protein TEP_04675 [Stenotrophomonas sp. TEPEL]|uniref:hypothetical protein n=1 Tax=Stenotrophomonas sp. TEPEL TaxID=2283801 RepID=UPI001046FE79|nr:hypothetical protein [Stenotrophomonas sp. TEPEL]TDB33008.1 hypothetical protein TEP_04675 [Stenotrophomonas sp. TEPEL]